ncbi:hypothetical protein K504DRAFT_457210, partial [Pleomassaria siparia CBS 279.74]
MRQDYVSAVQHLFLAGCDCFCAHVQMLRAGVTTRVAIRDGHVKPTLDALYLRKGSGRAGSVSAICPAFPNRSSVTI